MAQGDSAGAEAPQDLMRSIEQLRLQETSILLTEHDQSELIENDFDDPWCEDGFQIGNQDDDSRHDSVALNREWMKRHDQFHKMGYRDGITEGQKASAQEGFNVGFKLSAPDGYRWGVTRGITSALESLTDNFKVKLIEVHNLNRFQSLQSSVKAISADEALKLYHTQLLKDGMKSIIGSEDHLPEASVASENKLAIFSKELKSLLHESPDIKVNAEF